MGLLSQSGSGEGSCHMGDSLQKPQEHVPDFVPLTREQVCLQCDRHVLRRFPGTGRTRPMTDPRSQDLVFGIIVGLQEATLQDGRAHLLAPQSWNPGPWRRPRPTRRAHSGCSRRLHKDMANHDADQLIGTGVNTC